MPESLRRTLIKINHGVHKVILILGEISLVLMLVLVLMTVILRWLGKGFAWAEELPRLMVTLFVFLACSMGVRDHMHVSVGIIYKRFAKGGKMRKALDILTDVVILLCGLFMLYYGGQRFWKLFHMSGVLPGTGLNTAWQYLPIPIAGFVMSMDSILFLTGILSPDDLLYSEPEVDYEEQVIHEPIHHKEAQS